MPMTEKDNPSPNAGPCEVSREKYWEEMGLEQKIESLGRTVEFLTGLLRDSKRGIELLQNHSHTQTGEIHVPIWRKNEPISDSYFYKNPLRRGK